MEGRGIPDETTTRKEKLKLADDAMEDVDSWFDKSDIRIGDAADTRERRDLAKRLFYTWRGCFARTSFDLKATDMIEHSIDQKCRSSSNYRRNFEGLV